MGNPIIRTCSAEEILSAPNLPELLAEYGTESSIPGIGAPNFQPDMYRMLETSGSLVPIGAFDNGQLIGFVSLLVNVLPHYGVRVGVIESFFVAKAARDTGAGIKLRAVAEAESKARGAVGLLISAPTGGRLAAVLGKDKAYTETNQVFFRGLA